MRKAMFVFSILALVCFSATAMAGLKWKPFNCPAGGFSIMMPGEPSLKKKTDSTPVGHINENIYSYKDDKMTFTAEYSDLPGLAVFFGGHKTVYSKSKEGFLKSTKGTQISFDQVKVQGVQGRELIYKTPTRFGKVIFLLVHKRLYVIQGSVVSGGDKSAIDQFLKTFKLTNHKPQNHPNRRHRNKYGNRYGNRYHRS